MATSRTGGVDIERDVLRQQLLSWGLEAPTVETVLHEACCVRTVLTRVLERTTRDLADIVAPRASSAREPVAGAAGSSQAGHQSHQLPEPAPEDDPVEAPRAANPWNTFQARLAGSGLSREQIREAYGAERAALTEVRLAPQPSIQEALVSMSPPSCSHGYDVLRAPTPLLGLRGVHVCTWLQLMAKFGLKASEWDRHRCGFYVPRFADSPTSHCRWAAQGLTGDVPVFCGPATTPTCRLA